MRRRPLAKPNTATATASQEVFFKKKLAEFSWNLGLNL
jgi:hypothetical protein